MFQATFGTYIFFKCFYKNLNTAVHCFYLLTVATLISKSLPIIPSSPSKNLGWKRKKTGKRDNSHRWPNRRC